MNKIVMFAAAALALAVVTPSFAAQPVQGVARGGAYKTVLVDGNGKVAGAFVADSGSDFTKQVSLTDTTVTALHAASATSKICMTWIDAEGVSTTTAVTLSIKDGTTLKALINMPAGASQRFLSLPTPICGTANTAMNAVLSGSPTGAVQVNAGGYLAP